MTLREPVVFVGGSPRSGTTLTRNMLDCHPALCLPDESYFVTMCWQALIRRWRPDDTWAAWQLIRRHRSFQMWKLDREVLASVVAEHPPRMYQDLIRAVFEAYARQRGKDHVGDKTTTAFVNSELLATWFPRAKWVHVLRDPREASMSLALQYWHRGGLVAAGLTWRHHVEAARRFGASHPDRFLEVRYEDLVDDPARVTARMAEFLGFEPDPAMLDYTGSSTLLPDPHHDRARQPIRRITRPWWLEMSPAEVAEVELGAGPVMIEAGYGPVGPPHHPAAYRSLLRYKAFGRWESRVQRRQRGTHRTSWQRPSPPEGTVLTPDDVLAPIEPPPVEVPVRPRLREAGSAGSGPRTAPGG